MRQKIFHPLNTISRSNLPMNSVYIDSEANLNKERLPSIELAYTEETHYPYLMCASFVHYSNNAQPTNKIYAERVKDIIPNAPNFWENAHVENYLPIKTLWEDIDKFTVTGKPTTVYAHNIDYDINATGAINDLTALGYRLPSPIYAKGSVYIATFTKKVTKNHAKKIILLSSTNYFPMPLKKLAQAFNLSEKKEFSFETGTFLEAIPYCQRDVEIVRKAIEGFRNLIKDEDLGPMKPTVASQAFATFRYKFMPTETIYIHADPLATLLERDSYVGGRTEVFKRGEFGTIEAYAKTKGNGSFYKLDFNSMYASVMQTERFPTALKTVQRHVTVGDLTRYIKNGYLVIAKVLVNTSHTSPHTPLKTKEKLIFPGGEFETTLATPDIIPLLAEGRIKKVTYAALYTGSKIFTEYVNYFYSQRLKAKATKNTMYDQMYKTILSSLYGKFGQKSEEWENQGPCSPEEFRVQQGFNADTEKAYTQKFMGGSIFISESDEVEAFQSFPAIASHVTSYARQRLSNAMDIAKRKNLYYCDTDSLFVNKAGYIRLVLAGIIHQSLLGKMKLEDDTINYLKLSGAKDYIIRSWNELTQTYENHVTLKGVGKQYLITESIDLITKERIYTTRKWPKTASRLRKGEGHKRYYTEEVIKRIKNKYNGGDTQADGTVTPYIYLNNVKLA